MGYTTILLVTAGHLRQSSLLCWFRVEGGGVELGEAAHFKGRQLRRNRAHPLVDVILPHALSKGRELTFDIGGPLPLQRRCAELDVGRAVTCGARRNAARRVSVECEANRGSVLPRRIPALRALVADGHQSVGTAGKVRCHIGRSLRRECLRDPIHGTPPPLARTKVIELLIDDRSIHPRERGIEAGRAHPPLAVAGGAVHGDKYTLLATAFGNLRQCSASPGDACRRAQRRLRLTRRSDIGGDSERRANSAPWTDGDAIPPYTYTHSLHDALPIRAPP